MQSFGPPLELAAAFDAEVATRRGLRATYATAVGGARDRRVHARADPCGFARRHRADGLGDRVLRRRAGRGRSDGVGGRAGARAPARDARARRCGAPRAPQRCALAAAALTMFAAGAAVPGSASGGPVAGRAGLGLLSPAVGVLRARSLSRPAWRASRIRVASAPLTDLRQLFGTARSLAGPSAATCRDDGRRRRCGVRARSRPRTRRSVARWSRPVSRPRPWSAASSFSASALGSPNEGLGERHGHARAALG